MRYQHANLLRELAASVLLAAVVFGLWIAFSASSNLFQLVASGQPLSAVLRSTERPPDQHNIESVPFCVLVSKPDLYDERVVRTTAILITGYEQFFLYNPQCDGQDNLVWAQNDPALKPSTAIDKRLKSVLTVKSSRHAAGRAQVVVLGRFIGPGGKRFGHLDQFRMKFIILRVEQARSVSHNTPWPLSNGVGGDVSEAEQTVRYINKEFVFHLAGAPSYSVFPSEILADDFIFTDVKGNLKSKPEFLATKIPVYVGKIYDKGIEVYLGGDTAVVSGLVVKSANGSAEERYHYTNNYVRHVGAWQLVSSRLKGM